jgi:voltage-gated potassium channel Kch
MPSKLKRRFVARVVNEPLTPRRAALTIASVTLVVTVASGILIRFLDESNFPNIWLGLWWAVQTVTTVGYGDVTPSTAAGRIVASLVMLVGIGFLTVTTAAITATLIESARRRWSGPSESRVEAKVDDLSVRLDQLEALLRSDERRRP